MFQAPKRSQLHFVKRSENQMLKGRFIRSAML